MLTNWYRVFVWNGILTPPPRPCNDKKKKTSYIMRLLEDFGWNVTRTQRLLADVAIQSEECWPVEGMWASMARFENNPRFKFRIDRGRCWCPAMGNQRHRLPTYLRTLAIHKPIRTNQNQSEPIISRCNGSRNLRIFFIVRHVGVFCAVQTSICMKQKQN